MTRYHNPDPIVRLIGKGNESKIIVDGIEYPGLLDSGAQMSTITISQARKMGLKIKSLDQLNRYRGKWWNFSTLHRICRSKFKNS